MKRALLASLAILSLASIIYSQKRSTILGNAFQGVVMSSNETMREITVTYTDKDKNKTETFVGVLKQGYQVKLRDGTQRELQMSEIKPGLRIRVFYKETSEYVAGRKVKIATINRVQFLGRDEYTTLREALGVAPSFPVTLTPTDKLPAAKPLKLFIAIHEPYIKERMIKWVSQWNTQQGAKYGEIEIVTDLAQSDVAAAFFWGTDESVVLLPLTMFDSFRNDLTIYQATLHLVTRDDAGVKVLWPKKTFESRRELEGVQGQIERELEKRMKARGKEITETTARTLVVDQANHFTSERQQIRLRTAQQCIRP
jgi:hypothetical protein